MSQPRPRIHGWTPTLCRVLMRLGLTMVLLFVPAWVLATTRTWPGAAPCNGTLQACVNASVNGDTIEIATDGPIDESPNLSDRSLTLRPAATYHPSFTAGRSITASTSALAGNISLTLSGLRFANGFVQVTYNGTGVGTYDLSGLELTQSAGGGATYLAVEANGGTVSALLYDNRVTATPRGPYAGLIEIKNQGAVLNGNAYYNQVATNSAVRVAGGGLMVAAESNGTGTFKVHANQVRGGFTRGGIFVSEGLSFPTASSVSARIFNNALVGTNYSDTGGACLDVVVKNGTIDLQAMNNTVTRCRWGISILQWSGGAPSAGVTGSVLNNIVVSTGGLMFTPAIASLPSNDYNLINATSNVAALGPHTITADAKLATDSAPRLQATSPAIDAADTTSLISALWGTGLPWVDADGLRRIKGAPGLADIGAFEFGDLSLLHGASSANTLGHVTSIDNPAVNGQPGTDLLATPNFSAGGSVSNQHSLGVYYALSRWRLFNQDFAGVPLGASFNVWAPAVGSGRFRHVSSAVNTSAWSTALDSSSVNNRPDRIVLATQNWSAGASVYNPHPIGVYYFGFGGAGRWYVVNVDEQTGGEMPLDAGFNVYAQDASPNAFRVTATAFGGVALDHPLLDGVPCAQVQATRVHFSPTTAHFDVYYASGRWRIFDGAMAPGTQFNVVVDPAQIFACTDVIFADGFQ